jgi:Family of unknown function (DUF6191)
VSTFGGLDTLFNPAKRHLDEERLRLQSTREDIGDASGGKRIDLDSGRVKIARGQSAEDAEQALAGDDPADDPDAPAVATTAGTVRTDADADSDPTDPSSAEKVEAAASSAKRSSGKRSKTVSRAAKSSQVGDDENTPAGRARRRRAGRA